MYMEAAIDYSHTFAKKHDVTGLFVYTMRNYLEGNAGDLQSSLPFRNMGLAGRLTYAYDNRYLFEANFGYNGSERFAKKIAGDSSRQSVQVILFRMRTSTKTVA